MKRPLCLALLLAVFASALAQPVSQRYPSDLPGVDLVLTHDPAPLADDYAAETFSSLPDTDPYVLSRGLDLGLIRLVNEHSRQAKAYTVPRAQIRAVVRIKYDMAALDRTDLVFTRTNLILVHTTSSNAGMFVGSDVYELPFISASDVDKRLLTGKSELLKRLEIGLAYYKGRP
jgi:hypothetical protein